MPYTADNLISDFENLDKNTLQRIIDSQVSIIKGIVEHIKICRACYLGIYCCEYEEKSLEELWIKLVYHHKQRMCQGEHTLYFMANEGE